MDAETFKLKHHQFATAPVDYMTIISQLKFTLFEGGVHTTGLVWSPKIQANSLGT